MAEVVAVYTVAPVPSTPGDILATTDDAGPRPAPKAKDKWVMASVATDAASAIGAMFDEAERRDPATSVHGPPWSTATTTRSAEYGPKQRKVAVVIVCDFVHVLEYL